jgi:hypothetical protein
MLSNTLRGLRAVESSECTESAFFTESPRHTFSMGRSRPLQHPFEEGSCKLRADRSGSAISSGSPRTEGAAEVMTRGAGSGPRL